LRFANTGNQSGRLVPVALRIGAIARTICSGAAWIRAYIAGSPSHAANAAPPSRKVGSNAHIQPNPRGRRCSGAAPSGTARASTPRAAPGARTGRSSGSPASMRRISADSARSLADIQPVANPRGTGEIGRSAVAAHVRPAADRTTRRTTAFARCNRVERNGAAGTIGNSFSGGGRFSPADGRKLDFLY
jgi:hypothetical protein